MIKLATHDGGFHADDVIAYAILKEYLSQQNETWSIVRTRDQGLIDAADIAFDISHEYNPEKHRYDHHQRGRAGERENGILYASAGLIWKHFGRKLCTSDATWKRIDNEVICEIDAVDNGQDFIKAYVFDGTRSFTLGGIVTNFESTIYEDKSPETILSQFEAASDLARSILVRAIHSCEAMEQAFEEASAVYQASVDKRVLVFERNYERPIWKRLAEFPEVLFAVYPQTDGKAWRVEATPKSPWVLESRKLAPEDWRGIPIEEFREITGVADATFCHPSGFLFGAVSKQGAMKLVNLVLERN